MSERLFLCTDLDRTLIPNGPQPESPEARSLFRRFCERDQVTLAYVSGRHRSLVKKAIVNYTLPQPDYVVGDVGTTIYRVESPDDWHHLTEWEAHIGEDWAGKSQRELSRLFTDVSALRLQENSKQNRYKLSYYISLHSDRGDIDRIMRERLGAAGVKATLVWSVDEPAGVGLLDVLPARASKLHAIEFLMQSLGFDRSETLFSGDSGNDMQVLVSDIPAVLVHNAPPEVQEEARQNASANKNLNALYLAKGGFMQMNGNYSAGILEGVAHYHPQLVRTILADTGEIGGLDG